MRPALVVLTLVVGLAPSALSAEVFHYRGMCNASAAVALDANHFVVADDDRNTLIIYRRGKAEGTEIPLTHLDAENSDIEGAAQIGDLTYWIGSHDKEDGDRRRLFATKIVIGGDRLTVEELPPYNNLMRALLDEPKFAALGLSPDTLDIEGLAATPDGHLLIGLRAPLNADDDAIIIPLTNPRAVVERGEKPQFGSAVSIKLGGRGIRSIERIGERYLIIAGPSERDDDNHDFELFSWDGDPRNPPQPLHFDADSEFKTLTPEAIFAVPGTNEVMILSDDGRTRIRGRKCKSERVSQDEKRFRSIVRAVP